GLLNLTRLDADVSYSIDALPEPSPIFQTIQREGGVETAEMFRVFNMGIGFCAVVPEADVETAIRAVASTGGTAAPIGRVVAGPERAVFVPQFNLVSEQDHFVEGTGT
ncbi:MAG: AIR synthase-related protein, partial [Dehalococcoidia bacterium]